MASFYIAPEAGIPYKITGEDGTVAVLNDPADPNFVGYLNGEDALSGIDSPEIRDSFAEMSETDGSWAGQSFYTRRPIVMNGKVIPVSAADRNAKLGRLMRACTARFADGILEWTPSGSGGEAVFLRFRTQLPFRAKGGFNKEFQIGLVANDPRIYTRRIYTAVGGTVPGDNGASFYTLSGGTASVVRFQQEISLQAGTWDVQYHVRPTVAGGTAQLTFVGPGISGLVNPTTTLTANVWQPVTARFNLSAPQSVAAQLRSASATTYVSDVLFSSPQSTNDADYFSVPNTHYSPVRVGAATVAGADANSLGFTQPGNTPNPGNAVAPLSLDVAAPVAILYVIHGAAPYVLILDNVNLLTPNWLTVPNTLRAYVRDNAGASLVGKVNPSPTAWAGVPPGAQHTFIYDFAGSGTAAIDGVNREVGTRLATRWRGTFL